MFNLEVIDALTVLSQTRTEDEYPRRQEVLAQNLSCGYEELVDVAYDFERPEVRIEALELLALIGKDGYTTVLSDSTKADPDHVVQKHAEALLYRAIVNEQIRQCAALI